MQTYISILRGVNVSGQKPLKMDVLQRTYESLGFQQVKTYVQSGNVVFAYEETQTSLLEQKISLQIKNDFGFDVPVFVLTIDNWKLVIDRNPFSEDTGKDPAFLYVTFLSGIPEISDPGIFEAKKQNGEEIFFLGNAVYLYCPLGYGKTKLNNNFLETKLKLLATTRNWKTTNELLRIALLH